MSQGVAYLDLVGCCAETKVTLFVRNLLVRRGNQLDHLVRAERS